MIIRGAIKDYNEVIKRDKNNTLALLNRGRNKFRLKDYFGSIEDYNKAIKSKGGELLWFDSNPDNFVKIGSEYDCGMEEIRFERGLAYINIDSLKRASQDFQFCLDRNYDKGACLYWRGWIYLYTGYKEKGCSDLNESMQLGYKDANNLILKYCK